ncbi:flagellar basal-body MS-ring/collar protein FliF [Aquincola sp. MAHUQ-54]|uniref:Flagellar M-ring protein n=1 Tax=Aquincola agrisoli TaxID=3119538 RepID=A0AAW9QE33_9BURK
MITTLKPVLNRLRPAGSLPPGLVKSLGPLLALAVGVTLLVLMFLWRDQAGYKAVFGAREKIAAADMMAVLDAEGVPYRIHPDSGQVLVPEAQLGKIRMLLASKGVVAKLPSGLELMDRNDPLGVSQFVQDVRFRRGLEGELAQSIMTFDAVDSARVHLSIAKSSSFVVSDGEKSSASVVVALKPGRTLSHEQIAAAINLVAGSVASLDPQRVSLVDQAGNLLSARIDLAETFDGTAQVSDAAKRFTEEARRNVRDLLAPVLGEDNYKTSVTAEVDNDRIQETHETYGATPKVTNEAMRQEMDRDGVALGIPGSLSNRPVAVAASAPADAGTASKNATTRQYAYDRNITQIKRARGRLAKLNVAVVLNNAASPSGKGAWTNEEIAGIEKMLRSGLGINADRGDTLVVSALPFPTRPAAEPWWQQRDNIVDIGGYVGYALAALLGFLLVVRPVLKLLQHRYTPSTVTPVTPIPPAPQAAATVDRPSALGTAGNAAIAALPQPGAGESAEPAAAAIANAAASAAGTPGAAAADMSVRPLLENYDLPPPGSPVDVLVDHLKVLAAKEPERVAEVVKQWVQRNDRAEQDV